MLNNVIINSIIYRGSCWSCSGKKAFFEIVSLHICQLRIRLKYLVTICDFNNLCSKCVALQFAAIWKKKLFAGAFQEFLTKKKKKKMKTPNFQNTFCWLLSLCLLHTALISNTFFDENKHKKNGTVWLWRKKMEDSVFIKIEDALGKFCFWL